VNLFTKDQRLIPVKILCGCGQKYAFDVEPSDQHMVFPVQCPICGADGTAAANQAIADALCAPALAESRVQLRPTSRGSTIVPWTTNGKSSFTPKRQQSSTNHRRQLSNRIGVSLVLILVVVGVGYLWRAKLQNSHSTTAPSASGASFLRTLAELNDWYPEPPNGQNAATSYLRAFDALSVLNGSKLPALIGALPASDVPLPSGEKSAITALLRANKDVFNFLEQGSHCDESRYPIDLSRGFEVLLPHLPKLRSSALLLELASVLHADARQGKEAAKNILEIIALSRSLEQEPSLTSQWMRTAIVSIALSSLEQVLSRTEVPPELLGELVHALSKCEEHDATGAAFDRSLIAEHAVWIALLQSPTQLQEVLTAPGMKVTAEDRERILARVQKSNDARAEQENLTRIFVQLMEARKASFPGRMKADALMRQQIRDATIHKHLVLAAVLPAFSGGTTKEAESLAKLRLGLVAIYLQRFHNAHQKYPDELSSLVPDLVAESILDPFDGEPLHYQKTGTGFVLYSTGPDPLAGPRSGSGEKNGRITFVMKPRKSEP
jgi:hypothetical protein